MLLSCEKVSFNQTNTFLILFFWVQLTLTLFYKRKMLGFSYRMYLFIYLTGSAKWLIEKYQTYNVPAPVPSPVPTFLHQSPHFHSFCLQVASIANTSPLHCLVTFYRIYFIKLYTVNIIYVSDSNRHILSKCNYTFICKVGMERN